QPHLEDVAALRQAVGDNPRGVVVAGWGAGVSPSVVSAFATAAGWPVLADAVSGLRSGPMAVSTYDALLRDPDFGAAAAWRPDLLVPLGAPLTNRSATAWRGETVPRVLVDPDGAWLDPERTASGRIVADPGALLSAVTATLRGGRARGQGDPDWLRGWLDA